MKKEDFNQQIKRRQALKEYNKAFRLCLDYMSDSGLKVDAYELGKNLIKQFGHQVLDVNGNKKELSVALNLDLDWIIDVAISLGYKTLSRGNISVGFFSYVPSITIGRFLTKQKFGVKKNKDGTSTLIFVTGSFSSDYKLINRLCMDILEQIYNQV